MRGLQRERVYYAHYQHLAARFQVVLQQQPQPALLQVHPVQPLQQPAQQDVRVQQQRQHGLSPKSLTLPPMRQLQHFAPHATLLRCLMDARLLHLLHAPRKVRVGELGTLKDRGSRSRRCEVWKLQSPIEVGVRLRVSTHEPG